MKEYIYRESTTKDGIILKTKVEEVIKCKNCINFIDNDNDITRYYCRYHKHSVKSEDYCSYAETKGNG